MKYLIITMFTLLTLTSCTTMSKSECLGGEWERAGYEDAKRGLKQSRFESHAKACAKHGIAANDALYKAGYDQGLETYCQYETGVKKGRDKASYHSICPTDLEPGFLNGYLDGLDIALNDLDRRYSDARADLRNAHFRRMRVETNEDIKRIDKQITDLQDKIRDLSQQRSDLQETIATWINKL